MTPPPGYTALVFNDDFISLDTTKWKATTALMFSGYGQESWYADHVSVANGLLQLQATSDLHSGEVRSLSSFTPPFYAECRMQLPSTPGFWPGFWAVTIYGNAIQQSRQEIDVAECDSSVPHRIGENLHWGTKDALFKSDGAYTDPLVDYTTGLHTFATLYLSDRIEFYVDEILRRTFTQPTPAVFFDPMQLHLSLSIFGPNQATWALSPDSTTIWPATLAVDYVRVWQPGAPAKHKHR